MRVEIRKEIVGRHPEGGEFCYREGDIRELPDDVAVKWLSSGVASAVKEERETAAIGAPETAAKGTRKRQAIGR